jgi:hypothetical protein
MINRCNVIKITSNSSYITTRGSKKNYIIAAEKLSVAQLHRLD